MIIMAKITLPNYADLTVASEAYARITDSRAGILAQCEIAYGYMSQVPETDISEGRKALSLATMKALATRYSMATEGPSFEAATKIPANRPGGIGVSTTAIKQRVAAYSHVLASGLTPDILNVTAAFRLHSITAEGHDKIVARVTEATLAGGDFIELADLESDDLTAKRAAKRAGRQNAGNGGKAVEPTAQNVIDALKWATANRAKFSDTEVTMLNDMMAQAATIFAVTEDESEDESAE